MKPSKIYAEVLEESALVQYNAAMVLPCVVQGALMPDAHTGYSLPIGAVIKTKEKVFPSFVGYDIGCGVACLELEINYKDVDLTVLKEHILKYIPIGSNQHTTPAETTLDITSTSDMLQSLYSTKGLSQLGTLGGGNHFIEVGYLESNNNIAIVIHSGSRGFGHGVASYYMKEAVTVSAEEDWSKVKHTILEDFKTKNSKFKEHNYDGYRHALAEHAYKKFNTLVKSKGLEGLNSLSISSATGKQYMADQNFCLEYALLNRKTMINKIVEGIHSQFSELSDESTKHMINRNHNHAELKDGYIIHRKGATHAEKGIYGVIPGNMRDGSFIVKGKGNPGSMCSSSHGAGRVLSRRKAKETLSLSEFKEETSKLVTNHTDKMLDEAPGAYKDIFEVMELQSDLVDVIDRVVPLLNIKG